jgi:hypothetical protein
MMVFSTQLYELLPLKPSLWFTSPTPPTLPKLKVPRPKVQTLWLGRVGGVLSCIGDHILQEFKFNALFLTRWEIQNL